MTLSEEASKQRRRLCSILRAASLQYVESGPGVQLLPSTSNKLLGLAQERPIIWGTYKRNDSPQSKIRGLILEPRTSEHSLIMQIQMPHSKDAAVNQLFVKAEQRKPEPKTPVQHTGRYVRCPGYSRTGKCGHRLICQLSTLLGGNQWPITTFQRIDLMVIVMLGHLQRG